MSARRGRDPGLVTALVDLEPLTRSVRLNKHEQDALKADLGVVRRRVYDSAASRKRAPTG